MAVQGKARVLLNLVSPNFLELSFLRDPDKLMDIFQTPFGQSYWAISRHCMLGKPGKNCQQQASFSIHHSVVRQQKLSECLQLHAEHGTPKDRPKR